MAQIRTQIYLSEDQRRRLDARLRREGKSMAAAIREALEAYLTDDRPDATAALHATFGALPKLATPPRDEWKRG